MMSPSMMAGGQRSRRRSRRRSGAFAAVVAMALLSIAPAVAQNQGASVLKRTAKTQDGGSVTKASTKSRNAGATGTNPAKPALVGTFGDWGVYISQGAKSKICYALAQPKDRSPAALKRDSSYIFISNRPGEGVRGEVSIIMGAPLKDGASGGRAEIGSGGFDLVAKGQNAFIKNAAEEGQFVDTLKRRGSRLVIKIPSARGPAAIDTYSLSGVAPALDRVSKECP